MRTSAALSSLRSTRHPASGVWPAKYKIGASRTVALCRVTRQERLGARHLMLYLRGRVGDAAPRTAFPAISRDARGALHLRIRPLLGLDSGRITQIDSRLVVHLVLAPV